MEPTPNWTRLNTWSFAGLQRSGTAKCRGLARYPFSAPFLFYELSSVLQILFFLLLDQAMARTCVRMSRSGSVLSANVVAEHQRHSSRAIENGIARVASECRDSIASWERGPFLIPLLRAAKWNRAGGGAHNGPKSLILAPQDIPDISGYQLGFGRRFVKAYNTENPVTSQKIL